MKPKTMILMGLAIACGLGASYMTSRLLADRVEPEKELVEVLVAKKDLAVGQYLAKPEEFFEPKMIPKENDKMENIRSLDGLKGKILKQARNKGEAVSAQSLFDKNEQIHIPEGFQAIGLRVNLETSAHGLATLPHSHVDVLYTRRTNSVEDSSCFYLLQNILVLAADGKIERDGVTAVAQVVTLALTPEDVLRLNLAKDTGIINLSLRSPGDTKIRDVVELKGSKLLQKYGATEEPEEPKVAAVKKIEPKVIAQAPTDPPAKIEPPIVELPKGVAIFMDIHNGSRHSRYSARVDETNRIIDDTLPTPSPAPPQPKNRTPDDV